MKSILLFSFLTICIGITAQTYNVIGNIKLDTKTDTSVTIKFDRITPLPEISKSFKTDASGNISGTIEFGYYNISISESSKIYDTILIQNRLINKDFKIDTSIFKHVSLIFVPQNKKKIQDAINYARDNDTVVISQGRYKENLVLKKQILIASTFLFNNDTSVIKNTIIDGQRGCILRTDLQTIDGVQTKLLGIKFVNGPSGNREAIEIERDGIIDYCILDSNTTVHLSGKISNSKFFNSYNAIYGYYDYIEVDNCIIANNYFGFDLVRGNIKIRSSIIYNNNYGVVLGSGTDVDIVNSILKDGTPLTFGMLETPVKLKSQNSCYINSSDLTNLNLDPLLGLKMKKNANGDSCDYYGNIFFDPKFVDAAHKDFHLSADSKCIEAGLNDGVGNAFDFDGNCRAYDNNNDGAAITDMGIYEVGAHKNPNDYATVKESVTFCKGENRNLKAVNNVSNIVWDGNPSLGQTINVSQSGTYKYTSKYNGCSVFHEFNVTSKPLPNLEFGKNVFFSEIQLYAYVDGDASILWSNGATSSDIFINPELLKETTQYKVTATLDGCSVSDSITIIGTTLSMLEEKDLNIYPNPAYNTLNIQINQNSLQNGTSISLLNNLGQVVSVFKIKSAVSSIDVSGYKRGLYFVKIGNAANKSIPVVLQ